MIKPKVKLIGNDGNAFAILANCKKQALKQGWTVEDWKEFQAKATSGDYNHLLGRVMEYFDVD